jgi:hypothetical protein
MGPFQNKCQAPRSLNPALPPSMSRARQLLVGRTVGRDSRPGQSAGPSARSNVRSGPTARSRSGGRVRTCARSSRRAAPSGRSSRRPGRRNRCATKTTRWSRRWTARSCDGRSPRNARTTRSSKKISPLSGKLALYNVLGTMPDTDRRRWLLQLPLNGERFDYSVRTHSTGQSLHTLSIHRRFLKLTIHTSAVCSDLQLQ